MHSCILICDTVIYRYLVLGKNLIASHLLLDGFKKVKKIVIENTIILAAASKRISPNESQNTRVIRLQLISSSL